MSRFIIIGIVGLAIIAFVAWPWRLHNPNPQPAKNNHRSTMKTISVHSSAFDNDGQIPKKYTCDGENISPPLSFDTLPPEVRYLAIVLDDPQAIRGTYDHWVVFDIPATTVIPEHTTLGVVGQNSSGTSAYTGPCPPNGEHQYHFRVFGYAVALGLSGEATKTKLLGTLDGQALAAGELFGRYGANR